MAIYCKAQLMCIFRQFNNEFFDGFLPMPNFKIIHSYKYFGYFKTDIYDNIKLINPVIEISDYYEYTDYQIRDILVHEMIHYYLAYTGKDIKCTHGYEFHKMADEFNRKYRLNITETINEREYEIRKGASRIKYVFFKLFQWF